MNYIMRLSSRSCDLCFGEVFKKRNDAIDTSINNQTSKSQWKTNELFIESFNKKWNGKNIQWLIYKLQKNTEIYLHKEVKEILACIYHCFVEVDRMNYYLVISLCYIHIYKENDHLQEILYIICGRFYKKGKECRRAGEMLLCHNSVSFERIKFCYCLNLFVKLMKSPQKQRANKRMAKELWCCWCWRWIKKG